VGALKRQPALPKLLRDFHATASKATLHEALLDLWLEHNSDKIGDVHPVELSQDVWAIYIADVLRRAEARRRQG